MRKLLRGPVISLASQGVGVLQLVIVLAFIGADEATDAFFYLFALGLVPILILLVGLMYPMLLNERRISKRGLARLRVVTPLASTAFVVSGATWLSVNDRLASNLVVLAFVIALNSAFQALCWFNAVAAESIGEPLWISGVALPANTFATIMAVIPWPTSAAAMTAMAVGLTIGNAVTLAAMLARRVGAEALTKAPGTPAASRGSYWFLGKASVGYGAQVVMQSAAVQLPAAGVTILNVANKVVGSISATFVNAVMPHMVHEASTSPDPARRFLRLMLAGTTTLGILIVAITAMVAAEHRVEAVALAAWLAASTGAAVAQRMAFRFLPANASRFSIVVVAAVSVLVAASASSDDFKLVVLLSALALMDAVTALLLLAMLRDRVGTLWMGLSAALATAIWAGTLIT
ncbi:hypothetical protein [Nocardioides lianchengensis]|uniref:Membrane protein involved in the export of O-antigen and teichoic acid n=1 Tax=Nocardioides lianchengensis TaxID=1045774 RepID=A0A1G7AYQ3_9ACTN|nr:hypothetical protein [Nocardioides lianchengensis]NYG13325.1 hypothetical protein [Nocardioides lianchengensis]SDE19106.1 hypothetical protein SAMN05421872_116103 [Nocardioides lianchengensis]